LSKNIFK